VRAPPARPPSPAPGAPRPSRHAICVPASARGGETQGSHFNFTATHAAAARASACARPRAIAPPRAFAPRRAAAPRDAAAAGPPARALPTSRRRVCHRCSGCFRQLLRLLRLLLRDLRGSAPAPSPLREAAAPLPTRPRSPATLRRGVRANPVTQLSSLRLPPPPRPRPPDTCCPPRAPARLAVASATAASQPQLHKLARRYATARAPNANVWPREPPARGAATRGGDASHLAGSPRPVQALCSLLLAREVFARAWRAAAHEGRGPRTASDVTVTRAARTAAHGGDGAAAAACAQRTPARGLILGSAACGAEVGASGLDSSAWNTWQVTVHSCVSGAGARCVSGDRAPRPAWADWGSPCVRAAPNRVCGGERRATPRRGGRSASPGAAQSLSHFLASLPPAAR
jgi:hypothetical protein